MEASLHASMRGYMCERLPTTDALRNRSIRHGHQHDEQAGNVRPPSRGSIGSLLPTKALLQMRNGCPRKATGFLRMETKLVVSAPALSFWLPKLSTTHAVVSSPSLTASAGP